MTQSLTYRECREIARTMVEGKRYTIELVNGPSSTGFATRVCEDSISLEKLDGSGDFCHCGFRLGVPYDSTGLDDPSDVVSIKEAAPMTFAQFRDAALQRMNVGEVWTLTVVNHEGVGVVSEFTGKVTSLHDDGFLIQNGASFITMSFLPEFADGNSDVVNFHRAKVS